MSFPLARVTDPSRRHSLGAVVGILTAHNLIQNFLLYEKGYVAGNLAVTAMLTTIGRGSGASWDEMGLRPQEWGNGLKIGGVSAAAATAGAVAAMAHPRTRDLLTDEHPHLGGHGAVVWRALTRFPIGTALFEEVAFRGVLPAVIGGDTGRADALSSVAFAAWHLIPTARLQRGLSGSRARPAHHQATGTILGAVAAGVAGLGLSWIRRRTGSLLAPWLVHATVNSTAFLAGVAARRPSPRHRPHQGS